MRRAYVFLALLAAGAATAQQKKPDLSEIAAEAGVIFRGEVVGVAVISPQAPDELCETRVTLRVEDGVRGVASGEVLTIRQWNAAADEYRIGESLVLFLHLPSSQLGLTSPVGGRAGHRRVDEVSPQFLDALRAPGEPRIVPVRPVAPTHNSGQARKQTRSVIFSEAEE
ncbi:MAG: hypothetical protein ACRD3E_11870 [Terriglobales bacterium]